MTDMIYDFIANGVDMMITASIVAMVVIMLRGANILVQYNTAQQNTANQVNYYKEYSMYDEGEKLTSSDALSCISYYLGLVQVNIHITGRTGIGSNYTEDGLIYTARDGNEYCYYYKKDSETGMGTKLTYDEVRYVLQSNRLFDSVLHENNSNTPSVDGYMGGIITGISFTQTNN